PAFKERSYKRDHAGLWLRLWRRGGCGVEDVPLQGVARKTKEGHMDNPARRRLGLVFAVSLTAFVIASPARAPPPHRRGPQAGSTHVTRASWYGKSFQGRRTAEGSIFNPHRLTAAHPTLHLGSKVRVTELSSGRSVIVRITDRGPYLAGRGIDLSYAAARQLGMVQRGVARVEVELLGRRGRVRPAGDDCFQRTDDILAAEGDRRVIAAVRGYSSAGC